MHILHDTDPRHTQTTPLNSTFKWRFMHEMWSSTSEHLCRLQRQVHQHMQRKKSSIQNLFVRNGTGSINSERELGTERASWKKQVLAWGFPVFQMQFTMARWQRRRQRYWHGAYLFFSNAMAHWKRKRQILAWGLPVFKCYGPLTEEETKTLAWGLCYPFSKCGCSANAPVTHRERKKQASVLQLTCCFNAEFALLRCILQWEVTNTPCLLLLCLMERKESTE